MKRIVDAIKDKLKGKPFSLRSPNWESTRKQHLISEPFCAACGNTKNLQVHHIKPFHVYPELELEKSNLITLCEEKGDSGCHLKVGHLGNWKYINPNVIKDAKIKLEALKKVSVL